MIFPRQYAGKSFATRLGTQAWQELVHRRPLYKLSAEIDTKTIHLER